MLQIIWFSFQLTPGVRRNNVGVSTSTKPAELMRYSLIFIKTFDRSRKLCCISSNRRSTYRCRIRSTSFDRLNERTCTGRLGTALFKISHVISSISMLPVFILGFFIFSGRKITFPVTFRILSKSIALILTVSTSCNNKKSQN